MKNSYLIIALKKLLSGETMSQISGAKNSNQYFNTIKNNGIELIEVWRPNLTNSGQHKERRLHQSLENIRRAEGYLIRLGGKPFNVEGGH